MLKVSPARMVMVTAAVVLVTGCGSASDPTSEDREDRASQSQPGARKALSPEAFVAGAPRLDIAAKNAMRPSAVDAADPQFPIADLTQFDAVVLGTVEDFVPGPEQPVFHGDEDPIETVVMKLIIRSALQGEVHVGDPIYVRLFTDDLDGLKRAIPTGTPSLVAVSTVDETLDDQLTDPYAGVPSGEQRYIAGAPYAAFADGELKTWFPLLDLTSGRPLSALVPPELAQP